MSWAIRGYDNSEELHTTIEMNDVLREWFRSELGLAKNDPMVDTYPISADKATQLLATLGAKLPNEDDDYFVECQQ